GLEVGEALDLGLLGLGQTRTRLRRLGPLEQRGIVLAGVLRGLAGLLQLARVEVPTDRVADEPGLVRPALLVEGPSAQRTGHGDPHDRGDEDEAALPP